ncbi:hypothetical protein DFH06DRAFT_1127051 [Mycena polygramma]|nr:hypothetical protein DFH06DRAFT_1127051 [Mycena polygramma]
MTVILESHWCRIKQDFLHHFHMPHYTGRYRELPAWRKQFKHAWRKLEKTPITLSVNPVYKTDAKKELCTCSSLPVSRFLICKHVVQGVAPVLLVFCLEVKRQCTALFWVHLTLWLLLDNNPADIVASEDGTGHSTCVDMAADVCPDSEDKDEDDIVDTQPVDDVRMFTKAMDKHIDLILEFAKGLKFQRQFRDQRMLQILERAHRSYGWHERACRRRRG